MAAEKATDANPWPSPHKTQETIDGNGKGLIEAPAIVNARIPKGKEKELKSCAMSSIEQTFHAFWMLLVQEESAFDK